MVSPFGRAHPLAGVPQCVPDRESDHHPTNAIRSDDVCMVSAAVFPVSLATSVTRGRGLGLFRIRPHDFEIGEGAERA